jgi:FKBP-type peptidyl-prolyl cis-trans isomerase FklB
MKKLIILFMLLVPYVATSQATPDKKKTKKQTENVVSTPAVVLNTTADSVSYAAGMSLTNGLMPFLQQQYGLDETFMDDFLRGFEEAIRAKVDNATKAYGAGISIAAMLEDRMLPGITEEFKDSDSPIQHDLLVQGFIASLKKDTTFFQQEAAETLMRTTRDAVKHAKEEAAKEEGRKFLAENATKEGVKTLPSGLQYKVLREGTGKVADVNDEVVVKYEGRLIDGTVFDSSYERNPQTSKFRPNQVIKGWTEALSMMPEGSKWELYIPENLAYGERQAGKIPAFSTLIFTVEVDEVIKAKAAEEAAPATQPAKKPAAKKTAK